MGCGQSSTEGDRSESQRVILKIKVSDVPHVPPSEVENFKRENISDIYLHEGEEGFDERLKNSTEIMFKRWDWLQKNGTKYVNMLRLSKHPDEGIQACLDGHRPLCFTSESIYTEFLEGLRELKKKLEASSTLSRIRFTQTGSSVPGFSNNPLKGLRDQPSKITDVNNSDVDVVIIADGVEEFVKQKKAEGLKIRDYPCVVSKDGKTDIRYGFRDWSVLPPVKEWIEKWSVKMGGGVQITLQNGDPIFPPWELPIVI